MHKGLALKSAIAEHAWLVDYFIHLQSMRILQQASHIMKLVMKETLCLELRPANTCFNRDGGYELPDCWIVLYKKLGAELVGRWCKHWTHHEHVPRQHTLSTIIPCVNQNHTFMLSINY